MKKKQLIQNISNFYVILGFSFLLISIVLIAIPTAPYILYRLNPGYTQNEVENISKQISQEPILPAEIDEKDYSLPDFDPSLPEDPYILIPSIQVSSPIGDSTNPEDSLRNGSWIASDFGNPEEDSLPIIIAAHRFGYVYWDRETRDRLSYYNLPKTKVGDTIEIIWNQRKYIYEIFDIDDSTYIKSYDADLIIYTCKYFNSPQRIFRYANRVN
jgi:sortase (surface protein transpeptidase)